MQYAMAICGDIKWNMASVEYENGRNRENVISPVSVNKFCKSRDHMSFSKEYTCFKSRVPRDRGFKSINM